MTFGRAGKVALVALCLITAARTTGAQTSPSGGGRPPDAVPSPVIGDTLRFKPSTAIESLLAVPPVGTGESWSLAKCIQTALTQNAEVVAARAATQRASGSALSAWSGLIPSLTTDASYAQVRPDQSSPFRETFAYGDTLGTGLTTRQERTGYSATLYSNIIDAPSYGEKKRRDHVSGAAQSDESEARNSVAFQVKTQYFELLKADRLAIVARETEKLARDEETRSEALYTVGTVARGDVLKARARRSATQADRLQAENQVYIQAGRLKRLLGIPASTAILVEPALDAGIVIPDSADAIRQALTVRPRLDAARQAEEAAKSNVFGAKSQRLPSLSGSVSVNHNKYDQTLGDLYVPGVANPPEDVSSSYSATEWSGEIRASLPIFTGFSIEGDIRQAKANLLEAQNNYRQRQLDIAVEVQAAWLTLRESVQRVGVAREGLESAEEDYKFSKGRYDLGAGTYLDLLTAQVQLSQARQTLVEAMADARIAEAGLEFAIGAKRY